MKKTMKAQKGATVSNRKQGPRQAQKKASTLVSKTRQFAPHMFSDVKKVKTNAEPKTDKLPKLNPNVSKKQIVNDALKDKKFGSNARRVMYNKLGFKQDDTTTGYKKADSKLKSKGLASVKTAAPKAGTVKPSNVKTPTKKQSKISKIESKGKAALKSGNLAKAKRLAARKAKVSKRK
jgi:hypothetical protein